MVKILTKKITHVKKTSTIALILHNDHVQVKSRYYIYKSAL